MTAEDYMQEKGEPWLNTWTKQEEEVGETSKTLNHEQSDVYTKNERFFVAFTLKNFLNARSVPSLPPNSFVVCKKLSWIYLEALMFRIGQHWMCH